MSKLNLGDADQILDESFYDLDVEEIKGGFVKKQKLSKNDQKDLGKKRGHFHVKIPVETE